MDGGVGVVLFVVLPEVDEGTQVLRCHTHLDVRRLLVGSDNPFLKLFFVVLRPDLNWELGDIKRGVVDLLDDTVNQVLALPGLVNSAL